jgi:Domain of unknown function (DUF4249)
MTLRTKITKTFFPAILLVLIGCYDPYNPKVIQNNVNYLVVNGFFNGDGTTGIALSRTLNLSTDAFASGESGATVQIVGKDGSTFPLAESASSAGYYTSSTIVPNLNQDYQLQITTNNGVKYASDFVPMRQTPPIDTMNWAYTDGKVNVTLNTHDPANSTHYYLWRFSETWSYHSAFYSYFIFQNGQIVPRPNGVDIYHCWKSDSSTVVLVASSELLSRDVISQFLLQSLPLNAEQLQDEYSILAKQYAITEDAYNYWSLLKKNTENLGTIFSPQPSQVYSNIHCVTDPTQPVLGYFSACTIQQKRIFISSRDLPPVTSVTGYEACKPDTLLIQNLSNFSGGELILEGDFKGLALIGYLIAQPGCVDCRLHNGTNIKPDYWP